MFSGSLVAIVTPMHGDGSLDFAAWERLLDLHAAAGTAGVVVGGTTGESPTLSEAELRELLERARARIEGRMQLLAGVGGSHTAAVVERVQRLAGTGLDGLLVVTPAYNKPTQEGLFRHFEAVAGASELPVMLYNVPSRTAVDLLPGTIERLAKLRTVRAVKEATGQVSRVREVVSRVGAQLDVLSGDDATARESVLAGARGVVSVTANVAPDLMARMIAAALAGEQARAAELDAALLPLHQSLFVEANPIPVKWALAQLGLIGRGIRLPLTELSANHHSAVRAAMEAAGLHGHAGRARTA
ncbi:MAG TPA: 4-hydroxy-tetrahydrodipicolinate synthase [Steroidobacteraceae bacterium]|nr:4-hydroxy-tetrahydrodipicolinate synthase [Steroidobacteraceae bacterium]